MVIFSPPTTTESVRFGYLAAGLILYSLFMFFGSSFMGDFSDIIGRKKVLILCMAGFCIGFSLMGIGAQVNSIWLLFVGRGFTGLTAASLPTTMAAITDLSTPENKASNMSFVVLVQSFGFVLGPLMGGFLSNSSIVSFFDDSTPFFAASFLALIAFLWIGLFFSESFGSSSRKKTPPPPSYPCLCRSVQTPTHSQINNSFSLPSNWNWSLYSTYFD